MKKSGDDAQTLSKAVQNRRGQQDKKGKNTKRKSTAASMGKEPANQRTPSN
jgi:hypothetical protein